MIVPPRVTNASKIGKRYPNLVFIKVDISLGYTRNFANLFYFQDLSSEDKDAMAVKLVYSKVHVCVRTSNIFKAFGCS